MSFKLFSLFNFLCLLNFSEPLGDWPQILRDGRYFVWKGQILKVEKGLIN